METYYSDNFLMNLNSLFLMKLKITQTFLIEITLHSWNKIAQKIYFQDRKLNKYASTLPKPKEYTFVIQKGVMRVWEKVKFGTKKEMFQ